MNSCWLFEGKDFLRNVGNHPLTETASHFGRTESSQTLQNSFLLLAYLRLKICRFSAIRAFFSADRHINWEAKRLCWDTRRHTDRPFMSLCLPAACKWRRLVSTNHCLFLRLTSPLQTNKQTNKQTYKRPDGLLRTTNNTSVIKTPNNEAEVAFSLCPRNALHSTSHPQPVYFHLPNSGSQTLQYFWKVK